MLAFIYKSLALTLAFIYKSLALTLALIYKSQALLFAYFSSRKREIDRTTAFINFTLGQRLRNACTTLVIQKKKL